MHNKKNILLIVPGWPSNFKPNFMHFFYAQIFNLATRSNHQYDVLVPISFWSLLNFDYIKKYFRHQKFKLLIPDLINVKIIPIYYLTLPERFFPRLANDYVAFKILRFIKFKKFIKYDLVHAHFFKSARVAYKVQKVYNLNYLYTEHTSDYSFYTMRFNRNEIFRITNAASCLISVSPQLAERIIQYNEFLEKRIRVIPNGIDTNKFSIKNKRNDEIIKFLFIGHLLERKGVKDLLVAFNIAVEMKNNLRLTIIGNGELNKWCMNYLKIHNLTDKVFMLGVFQNDDLPAIIKEHDIFILPSKNESFGVVVIEAASCGLPSIVTECGGPESIINTSEMGIVLKLPLIGTSLSDAMIKMSTTLEGYNNQKIRDSIIRRFDWNIVSEEIINLYNCQNSSPENKQLV